MQFLAKIRKETKTLHEETENKPFLVRYRGNELTLVDHYRHLTQLFPLYQTLESKLQDPNYSLPIPEKLHYLLDQSKKIAADLQFIEPHIPHQYKNQLLKSTETYVDYLKKLDIKDNANEIFGHFLVRILGDLYGGQQIKRYVLNLFRRKELNLNNEQDDKQGVTVYSFPTNLLTPDDDALPNVTRWLNHLSCSTENEDKIVASCNDAFQRHIPLFDELESTRCSQTQNHCNLFKKTAFIGTAAIAASVVTLAGVALINRF